MAITINTNVTATFSQRALGTNRERALHSQEKIASGSRIVHGGDDAAGLAISEKNRASLRSLAQAQKNTEDAFGFINTADGAIGELSNVLIRLRELAVQAASDTVGDGERGLIEQEVQQLKREITRIATTTEYNGVHLLDGSAKALHLQVGKDSDIGASQIVVEPAEFDVHLERLGLEGLSLLTKPEAREAMAGLDAAQDRLADARANLGAIQNRLDSTRYNLSNYRLNLHNAESRIRDTDMAEEVSELTKQNLITSSNAAAMLQINKAPEQTLKLLR